jgi:hypothetical protein
MTLCHAAFAWIFVITALVDANSMFLKRTAGNRLDNNCKPSQSACGGLKACLKKMLIRQNLWRSALFRRLLLAERLKLKRSDAKSRRGAGFLSVNYYF